ncbi:MAG: hypothetical protein JWM68_4682, partial [Verrucomicrobiales bacterium]|nr:hypothetical protein [Verrucomicrobiales bacterium]
YQSLILDLHQVRAGFAPTAMVGKRPLRKSQWILAAGVVGCVIIVAVAAVIANRSKSKLAVKQEVVAVQPPNLSPTEGTEVIRPAAREGRLRPGPQAGENGQFEPRRGPEGGGMRLPMGVPPRRDFYNIPEGPVATMLAQADKYAAQHKENYEEIIDGYRQVEQKADGTPQAGEVAKRVQDSISNKDRALKSEMQTREAKMMDFVRQHKLQEAFKVWSDFPSGLRNREVDDSIRALLDKNFPANWQAN